MILDPAILKKDFGAIILLPDLKPKLYSKKANDSLKLKNFIAEKKGLRKSELISEFVLTNPDINP